MIRFFLILLIFILFFVIYLVFQVESMAAAAEEMSSLFPIFILSVLGLFVIPWTIYTLIKAVEQKKKSIHCLCSLCVRSAKYRTSFIRKVPAYLIILLILREKMFFSVLKFLVS